MDISTWLKGKRDYLEGLQLFKDSGGSSFTLSVLESGEDDYNKGLLADELAKLNVPVSLPILIPDKPSPLIEAQVIAVDIKPKEELPRNAAADVQKKLELKKEAGKLLKEMGYLKGAMALIRPGKALHKIARQILELNSKRQQIWDQIDFFEQYGYWFEERQPELPPSDLEQQIKNVMSYRTKAKAKLKKPLTRSEREYLLSRIEEFNKQIDQLKSKRPVK